MDLRRLYSIQIEKEQKSVEELFRHYVMNNPKRILNLFCGPASEEPVLKKLYSCEVVNIDNDPKMKEIADLMGFTFVLGDAKDLDSLVNGNFDLVLIRNIPISDSKEDCIEALRKVKYCTTEDASILITCLREDEIEETKSILRSLKYEITKSEGSKVLVESDKVGVEYRTKDHYIILAYPPRS